MAQLELAFDGFMSMQKVTRDLSTPGSSSCSITLERPYNNGITRRTQLASVVLSETTTEPVKFFTGWLDADSVVSKANGLIDEYSFQLKDILLFEDNELIKPQTLVGPFPFIADILLEQSGGNNPDYNPRLFKAFYSAGDIDFDPTNPGTIDPDPDPQNITFIIKEDESYSSAINRLCIQAGWEMSVIDPGWLSIANLGNGLGAIAILLFYKQGTRVMWAPQKQLLWTPYSTCGWWEGPISYSVEFPKYNSVLVIGKGGSRVLEENQGFTETLRLAVSKNQLVYQLPDLTNTINKNGIKLVYE